MEKIILKKCPFCGEEHEFKILEHNTNQKVKGIEVSYIEKTYYCDNCQEEFEDDSFACENLIAATDAYKTKMALLNSTDLKAIREKYDLSQSDFAIILDMGEVTITRYENGLIQSKSTDTLIKEISADPVKLLKKLEENKNKISKKNLDKTRKRIASLIPEKKDNYLEDVVKMDYQFESEEYRGKKELRFDKFFSIIKMILDAKIDLKKTKLAKLLFYCDFCHYKKYGFGITGLIYYHMPYGALPKNFNNLLEMSPILKEEKETNDAFVITIKGCRSNITLEQAEVSTVNEIIKYFYNFSTKEIVEYMHKEDAYILTKENQMISYEYANKCNLIG